MYSGIDLLKLLKLWKLSQSWYNNGSEHIVSANLCICRPMENMQMGLMMKADVAPYMNTTTTKSVVFIFTVVLKVFSSVVVKQVKPAHQRMILPVTLILGCSNAA